MNAARAVLVGALGTRAEVEAQAALAALEARQQTLPPDLEEAEQAERETRAACEQERARLEGEQATHTDALVQLREFAEALQDEASKARRAIGQARLEHYQAERQTKAAALQAAEAQAALARAALVAHDTEALGGLQDWPDLRLQFSSALPVHDAITEQLELVLAYRRALLDWQNQGRLWSGQVPLHWLLFQEGELDYPNIQHNTIKDMERALERHISAVQQRPR
jgi:DNA repair exonuclease SbcCD ATPase subunit